MKLYGPDDLKFLLMLRGLATAIRWGRRLSAQVRNMAKENDLIVQIKAEKENIGRYYILKGGNFKSKRGIHPNPEFSWVFSDAKSGFYILSSGKEEVMAAAMAEGKIRFDGDFNRGVWFNNLLKESGDLLRKPQNIFKKKEEE